MNRAIAFAKQNYYHGILDNNQKRPDKLWNTISQLINTKKRERVIPDKLIDVDDSNETITDSNDIAETFNNYFANIGVKMAASIQPIQSESDFKVPTNSKINNSIFFSPSTPLEVELLIDELKLNKSKRQLDVHTKFIKFSKNVISKHLSDLFNICVEKGKFPHYRKTAEVIPIFKKGLSTNPTNLSTYFSFISITYFSISLLSSTNPTKLSDFTFLELFVSYHVDNLNLCRFIANVSN